MANSYSRRQYLINKPFQFRYSLFVCSWIFALSLVYPMIISSLYDSFIGYMAFDPEGPQLETLKQARADLMTLLVILQGVFLFIIFALSIYLSHRIAGPLFKLNRALKQVAQGGWHRIQFRSYDHFQELAESYNEMIDRFHSPSAHLELALEKLPESTDPATRKELESLIKKVQSQPKSI